MPNELTLQDAILEVHNVLTGLNLSFVDNTDIFHATARQINRSLRHITLENEWGWYAVEHDAGLSTEGQTEIQLPRSLRPRIEPDDAVRFTYGGPDGATVAWAYFLPRDSTSKYEYQRVLKVQATRNTIRFSRPLLKSESGLSLIVPAMREPRQFELPPSGEEFKQTQLIAKLDFEFPDLIVAHAVWQLSLSNPLYQPRAQTYEGLYNDLKYPLISRDTVHNDAPYINDFNLGIGEEPNSWHGHPHSRDF